MLRDIQKLNVLKQAVIIFFSTTEFWFVCINKDGERNPVKDVSHSKRALMKESVSTSETSVNFYQTALLSIPEGTTINIRFT
jgi:hypothetical protein